MYDIASTDVKMRLLSYPHPRGLAIISLSLADLLYIKPLESAVIC